MSIIMRDGNYINTAPSKEDKEVALKEIGAKITAQRQEAEKVVEEIKQERKKEKNLPKLKEKSTKILQRTQTVLKKAVAAWPVRSDLQELFKEVIEHGLKYGCESITLRCRENLNSNIFWSAMGCDFLYLDERQTQRTKKGVNVWQYKIKDKKSN
mgnify:CR=1 FL=1